MAGKEQLKDSVSTEDVLEHRLILFNDDVNTFDYVIECLVEVCGHNATQAEQCAIIAHYKGKCPILSGSYDELLVFKDRLDSKKLTTEIS